MALSLANSFQPDPDDQAYQDGYNQHLVRSQKVPAQKQCGKNMARESQYNSRDRRHVFANKRYCTFDEDYHMLITLHSFFGYAGVLPYNVMRMHEYLHGLQKYNMRVGRANMPSSLR